MLVIFCGDLMHPYLSFAPRKIGPWGLDFCANLCYTTTMADCATRFAVPESCRVSGCYLLLLRKEVVYVGQSENILMRVNVHLSEMRKKRQGKRLIPNALAPEKRIEFDEFELIPLAMHELNYEENRLIRLHRPRFNTLLNRVEILPGMEKHPAFQALLAKSQEPKFRKIPK